MISPQSFFRRFRYGARSLKSVLALYFIPITIIPAIFISVYATRVFEDSTKEGLNRRAEVERDAVVAELESLEAELLVDAQSHAKSGRLIGAVRGNQKAQMEEALSVLKPHLQIRIYSPTGNFLAERRSSSPWKQVPYVSKEGLRRVKAQGDTVDRYFSTDTQGFVTVVRVLIKDKESLYGVLEEEYRFGQKELVDLKNRRQVDVVFMNRELTSVAGSFALSQDLLKKFFTSAFQGVGTQEQRAPVSVQLGENRFTGFLYDLPAPFQKNSKWGYLAVFLSMSNVDVTVAKLKLAIVYLTALLILVAALLIFVFSNRIVKPIELLVAAMKRVKTGREEQIPTLDSTYEIEYLVHSFNDMSRNVSGTKRALEQKLEELKKANEEIKNAQSTLVQSAKMISLGQIVAGVAHELNNPIAFIYSNMLHLSEYLERIKRLLAAYQLMAENLKVDQKNKMRVLEEELELDFILKDMEDLIRSCVEGANRTKEIVLGLRTFSRMDESVFRPADVHEALRSTVKLLGSELNQRVTVHEDFGEVPLVECSVSQLNQVFMNFLSNAAQAIENKGDIWIRTRVEGEQLVIEIEDNGCGMASEVAEKIFDPFFTTKKVGQGTGLGLSIAYGLVRKHNGTIEVKSAVNEGTQFRIRLPLRQP